MKILKKRNNKWSVLLTCIIVFSIFLPGTLPGSEAVTAEQKSFNSPDEAVRTLVEAVRANDTDGLLAILGPGSREIIYSGDDVADRVDREKFLEAYDERNVLQQKTMDKMVLAIGADNWPMPVPVVKKNNRWYFDIREGQQEILNRRIGRNELYVMDVLHAYVQAQLEYAGTNCSGSGMVEFARKLISTEGKRDGLYWPSEEGEEESPLGPLMAQAAKEGYPDSDLSPFHGYYFKILTGQGKYAAGGTYNYIVKDRMILGFALVAYPAEYGNSGIMTFMVNQEGVIYQKNLGKNTKREAEGMKIFNPDKTWKKIEVPAERE